MANPPTTYRSGKHVEFVGYSDFVDRQLGRVRRQVRTGELLSASLGWSFQVFLVLLAFVLWDHWVGDIGAWGRLALLLAWFVFAGWLFGRRVVPPLRRRVNAAYAAKVVEDSEPRLKNGLINLVFLRNRAGQANEVVLREMEQQTATQLSTIPIDSTVDRSLLIRWLAGMAALVVLFVGYAVFSPKSTIDSLWRFAAPWSSTPRPSRVQISDVRPGDTTLYYGRSVAVSARVDNLSADEPVAVVYSTDDRQAADQRVVMERQPESNTYQAILPAGNEGATSHLTYRIVAGDATSVPFRAEVLELPSAVVDRIRYEFPAYTGQEPVEIEHVGDIEALEGTKVHWTIRTNDVIDQAYLELDPVDGEDTTLDRRWPLISDNKTATGTFTPTLKPDRITPTYSTYQVRFRNEAGALNPDPVVHHMNVFRDLSPVVEVLQPIARDVQVPEDGTLEIEIRALDPDFALDQVRLLGLLRGNQALQAPLLSDPVEGQVVLQFRLQPKKIGLVAGDMLTFWAEARDNRHDPVSLESAPNIERSVQYRVKVLPPTGSSDESEGTKGTEGTEGNQGAEGTEGTEGTDEGSEKSSDGSDQSGESDESDMTDGSELSETTDGSDQSDTSEQSGKSDQSDASDDQSDTSDQSDTTNQSSESDQSAESDQPGQSDKSDTTEGSDRSDSSDRSGQSSESNTSEGSETSDSSDSSAESDEEPLPSDGSRDADAFDRILDQMNRSSKSDRNAEQRRSEAGDGQSSDDARIEPRPPGDSDDSTESSKRSTSDPANDEGTNSLQDSRNRQDGDRPGASDDRGETGERDESSPRDDSEMQSGESAEQQPSDGQPKGQQADGTDDARPTAEELQGKPAEDTGESEDAGEASGEPRKSPSQPADDEQNRDERSPSEDEGSPSPKPRRPEDEGTASQKPPQPTDGSEGTEAGHEEVSPEGDRSQGGQPQQQGRHSPEGTEPTDQPRAGAEVSENAEQLPQADDTPHQSDQSSSAQGSQAEPSPRQGSDPPMDAQSPGQHPSDGDPSQNGQPSTQQGSDSPAGAQPPSGSNAQGRSDGGQNDNQADREDEANLEYARQATDLVLDYLEDQKSNPDRELLDRLGWTKEDFQRFLTRWQQFRAAAQQPDELGKKGQRELDELLKGLGLVPQRDRLDARRREDQRIESIREEGGRSEPPATYRERYRAYLKSRQTRPSSPQE